MTAPAFLAPDFRYAGDDWAAGNALTYVVWQTPPVYASDGVTIVTPGVPLSLTGYTVTGSLSYQRLAGAAPLPQPARGPLPTPVGALLNAAQGTITLSLTDVQTSGLPRQCLALWTNPSAALLLVQPRIVDTNGNTVTVGIQQLFVF